MRHRGGAEISSFLTADLMWVGGKHHVHAASPLAKSVFTNCKEATWGPGPISTGMENRKVLYPTGTQTPDRSAPSDSLYRLGYPDSHARKREDKLSALEQELP